MGKVSNGGTALIPEVPASAAFQNSATPVPIGETTPRPVMTTRFSMRPSSSLSGLVIVLTLPVNEQEGHLSYLSQSGSPAKETTVGGRTDDPRRERTRNAPARHRACASTGQRQRGVPRAGHLADGLLSLAPTPGTLWGRRRPPPPAARPGGAPGGDGARRGAARVGDRDQRGHLG